MIPEDRWAPQHGGNVARLKGHLGNGDLGGQGQGVQLRFRSLAEG